MRLSPAIIWLTSLAGLLLCSSELLRHFASTGAALRVLAIASLTSLIAHAVMSASRKKWIAFTYFIPAAFVSLLVGMGAGTEIADRFWFFAYAETALMDATPNECKEPPFLPASGMCLVSERSYERPFESCMSQVFVRKQSSVNPSRSSETIRIEPEVEESRRQLIVSSNASVAYFQRCFPKSLP